jgi:tetratricopeptide (TPR) repeat protein
MSRAIAAAALVVLLTSGAARAQGYAALVNDCQHPTTEPDKAIRACKPLAEMQGVEPIERAFDFENLAIAYQTKVDDVTAIVYFDKALKAFPDFWQARAGRAQSEMRLSDLEAAVVDFDLLGKMDTSRSDAIELPQGVHYWTVKQHAADGQAVVADDQTPKGMIDKVRDKLALALTARCADRASNQVYKGALTDCTLALGYAPRRVEPHAWRGYVEFQTGQYPEALHDLDAVVAADPKSTFALYTRGVVKRRLGDAKGGDADIHEALAADPDADKKPVPESIKP